MIKKRSIFTLLLISTLSLGLLTGCPFDEPEEKLFPEPIFKKKAASALHKSKDCDEFKDYLAQNLIEQYLDNEGGRWGWCPNCFFVSDPLLEDGGSFNDTGTSASTTSGGVGGGSGASASQANPGSVSGTNNQESGVDELDVLKTDTSGNIFLVQDTQLIIADAFPPSEINALSTTYLHKNLLVLFLD